MTLTVTEPVDIDLADRYRPGGGPVLLTGVQAIGRLLVEQQARDSTAGLRTGAFVSGYPGSPLGALDRTLAGAPELAEQGVRLVPAVNEELAATAVWGSQIEVPDRPWTVDGAVGVWYGKAPGVDRAGDPMRHGNVCGAHPAGGVLVLAGDDPGCKSSTIPSASEQTLAGFGLPVLYPADAADVVRLGLYGVAASRASGLWVGMKITADVADGVFALSGTEADVDITVPELEWEGRPWRYRQTPILLPPGSVTAEAELHGPRWAMLRAFLTANPINILEVDPPQAWLTVVAGGKAFRDVRQALGDLGLDDDRLRHAGIRLLRLGMIHPLDRDELRRVAAGCERILVVEEKLPFVETAVRDALYGRSGAPEVLGSSDSEGRPLVPVAGELTAGALYGPLRRVLAGRVPVAQERTPRGELGLLPVARTPYFCSGCPHNRSTVVPEGSINGGGIGCHAMVAISPRSGSEVSSVTQMGGEGTQWIGQSAFLPEVPGPEVPGPEVPGPGPVHMFQNMGDGTFAHSGQLAVQACIAAGVNITFKLLYNRAVAMTGGQDAAGGLEVGTLVRKLTAEGVRRIIVCADEPERHGRRPAFEVWHRDRLDEAQRILRDTPGVTVLIYDQRCAAESRRLRKRGALPLRRTRVVINEAVCEGCGDCGVKSNCLSVQPVDTEFGRKTRIDQTSCNTDYSCLDGDCPSFVTVELPEDAGPVRTTRDRRTPPALPAVAVAVPAGGADVFLAGIGGTGIVTVNQVLAAAALRDGLGVHGVDQTGLSQKAGPVTSHLRLGGVAQANRVGPGQAACYLALDLLVGADARNLAYADPARTVAVVSTSGTPTGTQVRDVRAPAAPTAALLERVRGQVREVVTLDAAAAALTLFGDAMQANFLLVGAAYQAGVLPISAAAIEAAIETNGAAVAVNIAAFRWGRAAVADPDAFGAAAGTGEAPAPEPVELDLGPLTGQTRRLAAVRAAQLVDFQDRRTAQQYLTVLCGVWEAERAVGERTEFSEAVAHGLHKLTAYKDEYEVARLLTDPEFQARLAAEVPGGRRMRYRLHPPTLRAMRRSRKLALGPAFTPVLRLLARGKRLRGTVLDPFGRTELRRLERSLRDEYRTMVQRLATGLTAESYDIAVAAAQAADLVRGYEDVKLAGVRAYRERLASLGL